MGNTIPGCDGKPSSLNCSEPEQTHSISSPRSEAGPQVQQRQGQEQPQPQPCPRGSQGRSLSQPSTPWPGHSGRMSFSLAPESGSFVAPQILLRKVIHCFSSTGSKSKCAISTFRVFKKKSHELLGIVYRRSFLWGLVLCQLCVNINCKFLLFRSFQH